jgi:hypothetical protein
MDSIPVVWRITELASVAAKGMSAVMVCSPMLLAARPKTPLRVLCIAAFEFLARLRGATLGRQRRTSLAHACDFASLRDGYYDHRELNVTEYRSLRSELRRTAPEAATSLYIQELRQAERNRPILSVRNPGLAKAVVAYRTSVLDLSLRWLQQISGLHIESLRFHVLLSLAGLMQLADDLLDWKDDLAAGSPSYVTAFLVESPRGGVTVPIRAEADALLRVIVGAARQDAAGAPLALAGVLTWTFVAALVRLRFPQ